MRTSTHVAAVLGLLFAAPTFAAVPVANEPFTGLSPGTLTGQGSGTGWSTTWGEPFSPFTPANTSVDPVNGLSWPGLISTPGSVTLPGSGFLDGYRIERKLSTSFSTGHIFVSGLIAVASDQTGPLFLLSLNNYAQYPSSYREIAAVLQYSDPNSPPVWALRLTRNGPGTTYAPSGLTFTQGVTHLVVLEMESNVTGFNNAYERVNLYVDPDLSAPVPVVTNGDYDFNGSGLVFNYVGLSSYGSGATQFDEIHVGPTFASVAPEPATLALAATAAPALFFRRRRR